MRRSILIVAVFVVAASAAALVLGAGSAANVPKPGDIITGHDLGFHVEKVGSDYVVGKFVVRVNGEWRDAEPPSPPSVMPAKP